MRRYTIRRIGLLSSFKVGCATGTLLMAIWGLCFIPLLLSSFGAMLLGSNEVTADLQQAAGGAVALIVIYLVIVVVQGFASGISAWLSALFYNLIARFIGGLDVELETKQSGTTQQTGTPPWLE
nr:DUF3566 domain-containing protein [Ardenticatena sp.]